jgi:hypothetical protein
VDRHSLHVIAMPAELERSIVVEPSGSLSSAARNSLEIDSSRTPRRPACRSSRVGVRCGRTSTPSASARAGRSTLGSFETPFTRWCRAPGAADPAAARHRAQNYLIEGAVLDALGQRGRAHDAWVNALQAIEPAAHESTRADLLWPRAQALVRLARQDEAKPVFAALAAQEFRPIELARFCRQYRCE